MKDKKVYLKNFGCQMNVRDSEVICGLLTKEGYKITDEPAEADIVIFNTCSVRQHAEDKVWSEIGRISKRYTLNAIRSTKKSKPLIGLIGCMAQNYKEQVFERSPAVDFVVGPSDIHKVPGIIKELRRNGDSPRSGTVPIFYERKIWETDGEVRPEEIYHTGFYEDKEHAYVVISEGCSNLCSYCVVPYVRGTLRNRNYEDILKEIEEAIAKGISKITLLGQNVNAYQSSAISCQPSADFIQLLRIVNEIEGVKEFSFITSHPRDTSIELFKTMSECDKLKKYLHLPVQSGSDKILEMMNRGYTRKFYLDLVDNYRKIVKGGILSTDIIVGFPGETEADFQDTYNLVKEIQFDSAYIFKYSPRPNTEALKCPDDVSKEEKERRHHLILELQKRISNKLKAQSEKRKIKTQSSRFLVISFSFALCVLSFTLAYALNLDRVKVYFLQGDYKACIQEGEKILSVGRKQDKKDELYYFLALSYLKEKDPFSASKNFKIILNEFSKSKFKEEAQIGLGDSYFMREDYSIADFQYKELLNKNPRTKLKPGLYYRLSQTGLKTGDKQQQEEYLARLKKEFPLSPEARMNKENMTISYTIQVGAFSSKANADSLAKELTNKGYAASVSEGFQEGNKLYKVRVGHFNNRSDAEVLEKRLRKEGYPTKIIS